MMAALDSLLAQLRQRKWTLSFAESCTGGKLSATVVEVAGVSDLYQGSIVSYSYEAKQQLLGVKPETLQEHGAVSEATVFEMVEGARKRFGSDVAVAVSGIAGPGGGLPNKPVGTVCFAFAGPGFLKAETRTFSGDRKAVQDQSVAFALEFLNEELRKF